MLKTTKKGIADVIALLLIIAISTALSTSFIKISEKIIPQINEELKVNSNFKNESGNLVITLENTYITSVPLHDLKLKICNETICYLAPITDENHDNLWTPGETIKITIPHATTSNRLTIYLLFKNNLIYQAEYVKPEAIKNDKEPPTITIPNKQLNGFLFTINANINDNIGIKESKIVFVDANGIEYSPENKRGFPFSIPFKKYHFTLPPKIESFQFNLKDLWNHNIIGFYVYAKDLAGNPSRVFVSIPSPKITLSVNIVKVYRGSLKNIDNKNNIIYIRKRSDTQDVDILFNIIAKSDISIKWLKIYKNGIEIDHTSLNKNIINLQKQVTKIKDNDIITFEAYNGYSSKSINYTVKLSEDNKPIVKLTITPINALPRKDNTYYTRLPTEPFNITIYAEDDYSLSKIIIKIDDNSLELYTSEKSFLRNELTTFTVGTHNITVTAYDDLDQSTTTKTTIQLIQVKEPKITFTPTIAYSRASGREIQITATAQGDYLKALYITINGNTYSKELPTYTNKITLTKTVFLTPKVYSVNITAEDIIGKTTQTYTLQLILDKPPTITIIQPTNNTYYTPSKIQIPYNILITDDFKVEKAELYLDGNLIQTREGSGPQLTLSGNTPKLTIGNHQLLIKAFDRLGNVTKSLIIHIKKDNPPQILTFNVLAGQNTVYYENKFISPTTVFVKFHIKAIDDLKIQKVELTIDGNTQTIPITPSKQIETITNDYPITTTGSHTATLTITDSGNQKISKTITFTTDIDHPPTATLTPTSVYARSTGRTIPFTVTVTDDYGINKTTVEINGTTFTKTTPNYVKSITLDGSVFLTPGTYPVKITIQGILREYTILKTLTVKIDNPPTAYITQPINGQKFIGVRSIKIAGNAIDDRGLTRLVLYVDNNPIAEKQTNKTSDTISKTVTLSYGTHYAYLLAYDIFGSTKSTVVYFTIKEDSPPYVKIVSPPDGMTFKTMDDSITITITVNTFDDLGVSNLKVYLDGTLILNKNNPSTTESTTVSVGIGTHTITATATDTNGHTNTDHTSFKVEKIIQKPKILSFAIPEINWQKNKDQAYVLGK